MKINIQEGPPDQKDEDEEALMVEVIIDNFFPLVHVLVVCTVHIDIIERNIAYVLVCLASTKRNWVFRVSMTSSLILAN